MEKPSIKDDIDAGLNDAEETLAALWNRIAEPEERQRCRRALAAVIAAELTMRRADALVSSRTRADFAQAWADLRGICSSRVKATIDWEIVACKRSLKGGR